MKCLVCKADSMIDSKSTYFATLDNCYVIIENGTCDIMVKPGDFATALNGDIVRIKVIKENSRTGKKEGKVLEVVTRKQTE